MLLVRSGHQPLVLAVGDGNRQSTGVANRAMYGGQFSARVVTVVMKACYGINWKCTG